MCSSSIDVDVNRNTHNTMNATINIRTNMNVNNRMHNILNVEVKKIVKIVNKPLTSLSLSPFLLFAEGERG